MCTLYNVTASHDALRRLFGVESPRPADLPEFGDIHPRREGPVVRIGVDGRREAVSLVWGFPPPPGAIDPVVNIRNLASPFWRVWTKPPHRCLIPVDRFSEWSQAPDPRTGRRRKVWFALRSGEPFAFAGLWRPAAEPEALGRYAFLTHMANSLVATIHAKAMPVILAREDYERWLTAPWNDAAPLARAFPSEAMTILGDA